MIYHVLLLFDERQKESFEISINNSSYLEISASFFLFILLSFVFNICIYMYILRIFYVRTFISKQNNEIAETEIVFVRGCILYECMYEM